MEKTGMERLVELANDPRVDRLEMILERADGMDGTRMVFKVLRGDSASFEIERLTLKNEPGPVLLFTPEKETCGAADVFQRTVLQ